MKFTFTIDASWIEDAVLKKHVEPRDIAEELAQMNMKQIFWHQIMAQLHLPLAITDDLQVGLRIQGTGGTAMVKRISSEIGFSTDGEVGEGPYYLPKG